MRDSLKAFLFEEGGKLVSDAIRIMMTRPRKMASVEVAKEESAATQASQKTVQDSSAVITRQGLDEERLAYQEELARGEIWLLEAHLKDKGLGCGGDLECAWKHSDNIMQIADETLSMTSDLFWQNLKALAEEIRDKSHPEDVKRGTYADEYPSLVVKLSEFRVPLQKKAMARR